MKQAAEEGKILTGDEPFFNFLAVLFPASQLTILDYNRVVRDLNGMTTTQYLNQVQKKKKRKN